MQKVQEDFSNAAHAATLTSSWVERNQSLEGDLAQRSPELLLQLGRTATTVSYSAQNLGQRPTIGLFGASQAGKSYLVSSLAAGANGKLTTHWDSDEIDFIRHVNPSGNNSEATGFATRFTHERHWAPEGFPVELKVLGEMELAMILINAFFADINQSDVHMSTDESFFLQHLKSCEPLVDHQAASAFIAYPSDLVAAASGSSGSGAASSSLSSLNLVGAALAPYFSAGRSVTVSGVTEHNYIYPEAVLELGDYVATNSNGKVGGPDKMPEFWLRLSRMLPFMTLEGRLKALSVFWQDLAVFNETYRVLARELLKLKGHSTIFAPREAFVSSGASGLVQNAGGTIMHITKLNSMFSDTTELTCALGAAAAGGSSGAGAGATAAVESVAVNVSRLAALALELRFNLESSGSLDDFDVLDLPGARSRDVVLLKDVIADSAKFVVGSPLSETMQMRGSEFFRRGKVGYLFERYARRAEIEQLLFCIGVNAQQDVTTVLTILSDWVEKNVGETPLKRAERPNPLTIVLTRYDEVFNRQLSNLKKGLPLDMNQELNIALNRIQKLNWFNEWTPGHAFSRVLLARKPNLGELNPWLEFDPVSGTELGIRPEYAPLVEAVRSSLLSVQDFQTHVSDFAGALSNVLSLNDGGVSAIAATLASGALSAKERLSVRTYKARAALQECSRMLSPFATRDSALSLEKVKAESRELTLGLLQCNALAPCFDLVRSLMEIEPERLEVLYQQGFAAGSNVKRFVQVTCNEYLSKLTELSRQDNVRVAQIASLVVKGYEEHRSNLESDFMRLPICYNAVEKRLKTSEEFKDDVITLLNHFYSEVIKTFTAPQLNMRSYMEQVLLPQENINEGYVDVMRVQVQLLSNILSDFNLYLGVNLLPSSAKKALQQQQEASAPSSAPSTAPAAPASVSGVAGAGAAPSYGEEEVEDDFSDLFVDDGYDDGYSAVEPAPAAVVATAPAVQMPAAGAGGAGSALLDAGQSVLGTLEGPLNHFVGGSDAQQKIGYVERGSVPAFSPLCGVDDTGLLPHLDENSRNYEFKFISDYMSTLMFMMCQINVLVANKYQFTSTENLLLCQLLNTMEAC